MAVVIVGATVRLPSIAVLLQWIEVEAPLCESTSPTGLACDMQAGHKSPHFNLLADGGVKKWEDPWLR